MIYKNQINNLKDKLASQKIIKNKIIDMKNEIHKLEDTLTVYNENIEVYTTIASMYSPTGAPAYIMDSMVNTFNECIQKYIDMIWPNASYTLNTFKENKSGDITTKFSETLIKDGKSVSVGSLSGGERRAISFAVDFAILDVLSNQFSIDINPIIKDEPFEALDAVGREIAVEMLGKISQEKQIFIVDHTSEAKAMFTKTIRIEKRDGISKIV
jgi:DNA repair exonuclease SbcCD ATPase subunit